MEKRKVLLVSKTNEVKGRKHLFLTFDNGEIGYEIHQQHHPSNKSEPVVSINDYLLAKILYEAA